MPNAQPGDQTDCRTEEGITVSMVDTVSFLIGQLMERDLDNLNVQEALKDFYSRTKWLTPNSKYTMMISLKKL